MAVGGAGTVDGGRGDCRGIAEGWALGTLSEEEVGGAGMALLDPGSMVGSAEAWLGWLAFIKRAAGLMPKLPPFRCVGWAVIGTGFGSGFGDELILPSRTFCNRSSIRYLVESQPRN